MERDSYVIGGVRVIDHPATLFVWLKELGALVVANPLDRGVVHEFRNEDERSSTGIPSFWGMV